MKISFEHRGDFKNTERFFRNAKKLEALKLLEKYGREGVAVLSAATPVDSGETSRSWTYLVEKTKFGAKVTWKNTNVINSVPIAIMIQYGHGTNNGGYVQGRDFINPAIQPIFDKMANEAWEGVTR